MKRIGNLVLVLTIHFFAAAQETPSSSITSTNTKIYFLNYVQVEKSTIDKLPASDIANMKVYTGNDAIRLHGERGKHGVVYIQTKTYQSKKKTKLNFKLPKV